MNVSATYFEEMYRKSEDPWSLASRWYERRKYDLTLAALPKARYRSAFEPGCSVGELSVRLAERCDRLLSWDREDRAVTEANDRLRHAGHAYAEHRIIPEQWPQAGFDLIVLSEILYYFDESTVHRILHQAMATLEPGGTLATVHWRHPVPDHALTGDRVQDMVRAVPALVPVCRHRETDFLLEVFVRKDPDQAAGLDQGSVAAAEGLL